MAGQVPGAGRADKGPTESPMQQFQKKIAEKGIRLNDETQGSMEGNPFQPEAPPVAAPAAPPAGADPNAAQPPPGAEPKPADGGTPDGAQPQDKGQAGAGQAGAGAGSQGAPGSAPVGGAAPAAGAAAPGAAVIDSATGQPAGAVAPELVAVEIEDPDTGKKFTVQAPKDVAEAAKGGWMRRADYTRKTQQLARYRPVLEPLMQPDPQTQQAPLDALLPYMNLAMQSADFARAIVTIANQVTTGQPISYGIAPAAPAGGAPAAGAEAAPANVDAVIANIVAQAGDDLDPLAVDALRKVLPQAFGSYEARLKKYDERFAALDQRDQQQRTEQQRAAEAQQASQRFASEARAAMMAAYPAEFTGTDADFQRLGQYYDYAMRSGYVNQYGAMAGLFRAKVDLDAAAREYTPSAGAAAVAGRNALDQVQANAQAKAAADAVAAGLGGGAAGGAATGGAQSGPNVNFDKKGKDGKPLSGKEFLQRFIAANPS